MEDRPRYCSQCVERGIRIEGHGSEMCVDFETICLYIPVNNRRSVVM